MISHQHRCIFVHIPKTAGNSVNRVFGVGWQDHKDLARYRAELPPEVFARYFKFAIVRNPWDRLFSDYNYQLKKSRPADSKLFVFAANGSKRSFAAWVETALADSGNYTADRWGGEVSTHIHRWSPQLDWLEVDGRMGVDFVAHLETLTRDFPEICARLNLPPARLPHRNRRLHWHYSHYYDHTTREIVADYYARDIAAFGYEFETSALRVFMSWRFAAREETAQETSSESPALAGTPTTAAIPARIGRSWVRRASLALAASVALMFGALAAGPVLADEEADSADPTAPTREHSLGRRLFARVSRSAVAVQPPEHPFSELLRFGQNSPKLHVALTPLPVAGLAMLPTLQLDHDDGLPDTPLLTQRAVSALPPGRPDPRVFRRPARAIATAFVGR